MLSTCAVREQGYMEYQVLAVKLNKTAFSYAKELASWRAGSRTQPRNMTLDPIGTNCPHRPHGSTLPAVEDLADFCSQGCGAKGLLEEGHLSLQDAVPHHGVVGVARQEQD